MFFHQIKPPNTNNRILKPVALVKSPKGACSTISLHDKISLIVNKDKKKPKLSEQEPDRYHSPKKPTHKRPDFLPTKRQQINQPQIRRPQHYA